MTSRHIIMGHGTSTGCLVTQFTSQPSNRHLQMTSLVPHALTTSRVSITKAGGLSDAPGAERSPNGKDGDTVTHVRSMALTKLCFGRFPIKCLELDLRN